ECGRGCSSGVEHDLAKVGVEGSNPFARSKILNDIKKLRRPGKSGCYCCLGGEAWGKQTMGNCARSGFGSVLHMKSPDAAPATLGTAPPHGFEPRDRISASRLAEAFGCRIRRRDALPSGICKP